MGLQGVRRLYLPDSSAQSGPEAPRRRSVKWGEFQKRGESNLWSSNEVGEDKASDVIRKCAPTDGGY